MGPFLRRHWKILAAITAVAVCAAGLALGWNILQERYNGRALARLIMKEFNRNRRGRMEIESVHWRPRAILDYISGQSTPVVVRGLKLYDVNGRLVVDAPEVAARIYLEPLRRNVSLVVEDLEAHAGSVHIQMFPRPEDPSMYEIGLVGLFSSARPSSSSGPSERPFTIHVDGFHLDGLRVTADIPSADIAVDGVSVNGGYLHYNGPSIMQAHAFHFQVQPQAQKAWVRFLGQEMNFTEVKVIDAVMSPAEAWELRVEADAVENGITPVHAVAHFGSHGVAVDAAARRPAQLASRYIPYVDLEDGPDAWASLAIRGTLAAPRIWIRAGDLRYRPPAGSPVENLQGELFYQGNEKHGVVAFNDVSGTVMGAGFRVEGLWDLFSGAMTARIAGHGLPLYTFVPAEYADITPRTLDGTVMVRWQFPMKNHVEVAFDARGTGGLFQKADFRGGILFSNGQIHFSEDFSWKSPLLRLQSSGFVGLDGQIDLRVDAASPFLSPLFARLGIPARVHAGSFAGRIRGTLSNPSVQGFVQAAGVDTGVIPVDSVSGSMMADARRVALSGLDARVAGGRIRGFVEARLGREKRILVDARADGLLLDGISGGMASGKVDGNLRLSGPILALSGRVDFRSRQIQVQNASVERLDGQLTLDNGNLQINRIGAVVAGVPVSASGRLGAFRDLDLRVAFSRLPVAEFTRKAVTGFLYTDIHITGTLKDPVLEGEIALRDSRLLGQPVPDSRVVFSRNQNERRFAGNLLGALSLQGNYGLAKDGYILSQVSFSNLDPQKLVRIERLEELGVTLSMSGNGRVHFRFPSELEVVLALTRATIGLPGAEGGRMQLALAHPASITYSGGRFVLPGVTFSGPRTQLEASGDADAAGAQLRMRGDFELGFLQAFLPASSPVRSIGGMVVVDAVYSSRTKGFPLSGDVYFAGNRLQIASIDKPVILRSGHIRLQDRVVSIQDLRAAFDNEELEGQGQIFLAPDGKASNMKLSVDGSVSMGILEMLLGSSLYSATGRAHLKLEMAGMPSDPKLLGQVSFLEPSRLFFRNGREITLLPGGSIAFAGDQVQLTRLRMGIEDGAVDMDGHFRWAGDHPEDVQLSVQVRNLVERSAGAYELEASGDLTLSGSGDELLLAGTVDLLNARYEKKYDVNLVDRLLTPASRTTESSRSFLESVPWLGRMRMDIALMLSGDIEIDNNFAQTKLEGQVHVGGTLASPALGGIVTLAGGQFRIPMLRGNYEIKEGTIDFDRAKNVRHVKDEPYLDVLGEMLFVDRMDNEHIINLRLTGFVSQLKLEWSSSSGLNSAQVLTLLMLNRTPDEVRRGAGGLPDLGGMLEGYVPLNLQLGITSESVQVFVDRRFWDERVVLKGNVEMGFLGQQQQEAQLIFRLHDRVQVQGRVRRRISGDESTFQEEGNDVQSRIELKYRMQFRGTMRDILGF